VAASADSNGSQVLHDSSSDIEFAYFPQSTIISVLELTEQGHTAEWPNSR
jgi:hypothetical protein